MPHSGTNADQAVLMAGVNDNVHLQRKLVQDLVRIRVRPYYLYQCDLVEGAGHFRTPIAKGIEIMEGLRGHTSGYAVHQYIIDAPGGGGKIPVSPNYLLSMSDHKIVLRNYEGYITTYEEPAISFCMEEILQLLSVLQYTSHAKRSSALSVMTATVSKGLQKTHLLLQLFAGYQELILLYQDFFCQFLDI